MLFPYQVRRSFFLFLAFLAYHFDRKYRRVVEQNLKMAYGDELSQDQIIQIKKYCYKNLLLNFHRAVENAHSSADEINKRVSFINKKVVDDALQSSRPIIFVSAHYSNWELGAASVSALITPTLNTYKKLKNPYFDHYLVASRSTLNMHLVEKKGALKQVVKALKNSQAVGFLIDQNTNPRDSLTVEFFGKKVTQTAAPTYLAQKYNALIIPLFIDTEDEQHYTVEFMDPLTCGLDESVQVVAQRLSDLVELRVKRDPKRYFWLHKRFKNFYPEIYGAISK